MKKTTVFTLASALVLLSATSLQAGETAKMDRFKEADKNADGTVTHAEMMAQVGVKFKELDKNKDGFLSLTELPEKMPVPEHKQKRMEEHKARMAEKGHDISEEKLKKMEKRAEEGHSRIKFLARMDKDGDEKVSLDEFASPMVHHFKRADENGDGQITKAEAEAAHSRHKMDRGHDKHMKKGMRSKHGKK